MSTPSEILKAILPGELALEIYKDVAQPTAQKVGVALAATAGILTQPIGTGSNIIAGNLEKYVKKLEKIEVEKIASVNPEIAIPILQKLRYTKSDELVNLYTELLLKASIKDIQEKVHPSYYEIITNLSPDEARILSYIKSNSGKYSPFYLPYLEIRKTSTIPPNQNGYQVLSQYFTNLSDQITLIFPEQEEQYVQNLSRLGIIHTKFGESVTNKAAYDELKNHKEIKVAQKQLDDAGVSEFSKIEFGEGVFHLTQFGEGFIETCVPKGEIN